MKKKNVYMLDEDDDKAIQLFVKLGMPKNLAKALLFVSQFDECKCTDVEQGTNLRQPAVHVYRSAADLSEILKVVELEKLKEVEAVKNDISELKTIIENR